MSEQWTIRKRAGALQYGDRFVFEEVLGGEGDHATVEAVTDFYGTVTVDTVEFGDLLIPSNFMVLMA